MDILNIICSAVNIACSVVIIVMLVKLLKERKNG